MMLWVLFVFSIKKSLVDFKILLLGICSKTVCNTTKLVRNNKVQNNTKSNIHV